MSKVNPFALRPRSQQVIETTRTATRIRDMFGVVHDRKGGINMCDRMCVGLPHAEVATGCDVTCKVCIQLVRDGAQHPLEIRAAELLRADKAMPPVSKTFGDIVKADIAKRDAKLTAIRKLAYTLIAKNGTDDVACRERSIGLDLVQIIAGDM